LCASIEAVYGALARSRARTPRKNCNQPVEMLMDWLKGLLLVALIFVPLERILARRPGQRVFRPGWTNDMVYLLLNGRLTSFCLAALVIGMTMTAGWVVPASVRAATAGQPYWVQIVEVLVLADAGVYFVHRAFHEVPWLWKFHAIHHSSEELDWLATTRVHPLDQIATRGLSLLPVFTLGFSDVAIGVYLMLYGWQAYFVDSNLRINLGPFRWLLASPEFHHWHHSRHLEARDRNFASQLPVLDLLFGTFYMPRGQMPSKFGLDQPIPATYAAQLLCPFRGILTTKSQTGAVDSA
jgi:sterol desaturase/sphingolipid hydroxylase (fatty acid hydroxylase superfamily)